MGRFAKVVFGRPELPNRCLVFGGAYIPERANIIKKHFEKWDRPKGAVVKCTYAKKDGNEYLVCFNVYGAAVTLELLHTLVDGKADSVFFVGSMGSRNLEIGTIVLPDRVADRAGIVSLDDPRNFDVVVSPRSVRKVEGTLQGLGVSYIKGRTASVPSVLHQVKSINRFLTKNKDILGVELELSTFHHFGRKLGLRTHGLLYVYDNPKHDIISGTRTVRKARMDALTKSTKVALATLQ